MQSVKAVLAAAAAARQWLRAISSKWRLTSLPRILPSPDHQEQVPFHEDATEPCEASLDICDGISMESDDTTSREDRENKVSVAASSIVTKLMESHKPSKNILYKWERSTRSRIVGQVLQNLTDARVALEFFHWASAEAGFKHDTYTTNSLFLTLVKCGQVGKAHEIFTQSLASGSRPDTLTVSTILYGLCDSGELQKACEFCEEIKQTGVVPYGRVLSTLIQALCDAGDVDLAVKLVRELTVDPEEYIYTYSIVIHTLCKMKRTKAAWALFYELQEKGGTLDTEVYGTLMHGLCKTGDLRKACKLLEEMAARGCRLDTVIYNILIDGFCKARKVDQAMQLLQIMESDGYNPCVVTFTTLIDGLCKAQEFNRAKLLIQKMHDKGCVPNVVTYSAIIDGLCKARRMNEAVDTVNEMVKDGVEPDLITYNSLIHGFCISQRLVEATWILDELIEKGFAPNHVTYCTLVIGHCRGRRLDKALSLLREMIKNGSVCNMVVYIDLIYGFCEANCGSRGIDGCCAVDEVGGLYNLLDQMVKQEMEYTSSIVFQGDSFYDPMSRLERVEQVLDFMYHKGCVGDDERFNTIQDALASIRRLKSPEISQGTQQVPFEVTVH